jgi:hypothetical protein
MICSEKRKPNTKDAGAAMKVKSHIVALTTIDYGLYPTVPQKVRSDVFLDTAKNLRELGIPCIALAAECSDAYIRRVREHDVVVVPESNHGMGAARREVFAKGLELFPSAVHYLWLEPEKSHLPQHALRLSRQMLSQDAVLGLFNRGRMNSYPQEQAYYYLFCRAVASQLFGFDTDYAFGPMIMTKKSLPYFLDYRGDYGNLWDSILIPRVRLFYDRERICISHAAFQNDERMKLAESGDPEFILKRVRQIDNVIPSLISEWLRLQQRLETAA